MTGGGEEAGFGCAGGLGAVAFGFHPVTLVGQIPGQGFVVVDQTDYIEHFAAARLNHNDCQREKRGHDTRRGQAEYPAAPEPASNQCAKGDDPISKPHPQHAARLFPGTADMNHD